MGERGWTGEYTSLDVAGGQPAALNLLTVAFAASCTMVEVAELQAFLRDQPDRATRPADEVLGLDTFGLPG